MHFHTMLPEKTDGHLWHTDRHIDRVLRDTVHCFFISSVTHTERTLVLLTSAVSQQSVIFFTWLNSSSFLTHRQVIFHHSSDTRGPVKTGVVDQHFHHVQTRAGKYILRDNYFSTFTTNKKKQQQYQKKNPPNRESPLQWPQFYMHTYSNINPKKISLTGASQNTLIFSWEEAGHMSLDCAVFSFVQVQKCVLAWEQSSFYEYTLNSLPLSTFPLRATFLATVCVPPASSPSPLPLRSGGASTDLITWYHHKYTPSLRVRSAAGLSGFR